MKVTLIIRSAGGARVTFATDFKRESGDTPRIGNIGLDIKRELDRIVADCDKVKQPSEIANPLRSQTL